MGVSVLNLHWRDFLPGAPRLGVYEILSHLLERYFLLLFHLALAKFEVKKWDTEEKERWKAIDI